jgi:hypothetical protein
MEINGRPYYIRSKGNVPYLYDIDTNDEVGYWSSKKGCYVMFSLYNKMMKQKYDEVFSTSESESDSSSSSSSSSSSEEVKPNSSSQDKECDESDKEGDQEEEEGNDENIHQTTAKKMNTYSLMFLFLVFFVYLTLQKEFQSIYFDFIFLILINLLNTLKVFEMLNEND